MQLDTEFTRGLNLFDATMVVVGSMIGSGIFIVSADMARNVARADVDRIAALARLELSNTEKDLFVRQLTEVLEYADRIQAIDTSPCAPDLARALATECRSCRRAATRAHE